MPFDIIPVRANLNKAPHLDFNPLCFDKSDNEAHWITYGDMHGNSVKLLWCLLKSGAVTLAPADYDEFVKIYKKDELYAEDLADLKEIISKIKKNDSCDASIRLIGDVVADRGKNDYITLLLLEQVEKIKVPYEIMLSNHDAWLIEAIEQFLDKPELHDFNEFINRSAVLNGQGNSLINLNKLLIDGLINREDITRLYNVYKKHLKLLSLEFDDKGNPVVYTHAIIDPLTINMMALELGSKFTAPYIFNVETNEVKCNLEALKQVVVKYNEKIFTAISICKLHEMFETSVKPANPVIRQCTWARKHDDAIPVESLQTTFIHGHNGGAKTFDCYIDLDGLLGKSDDHMEGAMAVCKSRCQKPAVLSAAIDEADTRVKQELKTKGRAAQQPETAKQRTREISMRNAPKQSAQSAPRAVVYSVDYTQNETKKPVQIPKSVMTNFIIAALILSIIGFIIFLLTPIAIPVLTTIGTAFLGLFISGTAISTSAAAIVGGIALLTGVATALTTLTAAAGLMIKKSFYSHKEDSSAFSPASPYGPEFLPILSESEQNFTDSRTVICEDYCHSTSPSRVCGPTL